MIISNNDSTLLITISFKRFWVLFRHVLTAGHCVCSLEEDFPDDIHHCLSADQNQILDGKNNIRVFGGSRSLFTMERKGSLQWNMDEAYLMDGFSKNHEKLETFDVGIVITNNKQFFNPELLNQKIELGKANIVPVCLAAVNTPLGDKKFKLLGWGKRYEEEPMYPGVFFDKRNPILSSCMTEQAGPLQWRFQNCDMKTMKKGVLFDSWSCETKKPPPTYTRLEEQKCKDYWIEAMNTRNQLGLPSSDIEAQDQLHITATDGSILNTCYNPGLLRTQGWCKLFKSENSHASIYPGAQPWGICSPSCNKKILKVLIYTYHGF